MKTGRVRSIAAVLAVLALGACDNPSGGGSPPPGGNGKGSPQVVSTTVEITAIPEGFRSGGGTYSGIPIVTINSVSLTASMSNGALILQFPASLKQAASEGAIDLGIPKALIQIIVNNKAIPGLKFEQGADTNTEISVEDAETIRARIVDEIKSIVAAYTTTVTYDNGTADTSSGSKPLGELIPFTPPIINYGAMIIKNADYTATVSDPNPSQTVSLWGNSAVFLKDAGTGQVSLTIAWTGSASGDLSAISGAVVTEYVTGKTITVMFVKTGAGAGSDRVSFGRITALKLALAGAASVTMSGSGVDPVFNGDDLFGHPGVDTSGTYQTGNTGKVFYVYGNGEEIFDGFIVKNASGSSGPGTGNNPLTGWHIDNVGNKTLYVERIKVKGHPFGYLNGFGLKSAYSHLTFTTDLTLSGRTSPSDTASSAAIIPEHLVAGLSLLGITASTMPATLPEISGLTLRANYLSGSDKNLLDYPVLLAFLNAYMTSTDKMKLDGLTINASSYGSLSLQKAAVPYTVNGYSGVGESDKVNGNLAVWLGSKGVALREVYLTNPNLYTSATSGGTLRNVVLEGNNWKNITVAEAHGVIVSVNTPVAGMSNPNNSNLWYVVQGQSDSGYITQIVTSVLEVGNIAAPGTLVPANATNALQALITANSTVRSAINSNFWPIAKDYVGAPPVGSTWQTYAEAVKNNTTPPVFQ